MFTLSCNAKGITGTMIEYKKMSCPVNEHVYPKLLLEEHSESSHSKNGRGDREFDECI